MAQTRDYCVFYIILHNFVEIQCTSTLLHMIRDISRISHTFLTSSATLTCMAAINILLCRDLPPYPAQYNQHVLYISATLKVEKLRPGFFSRDSLWRGMAGWGWVLQKFLRSENQILPHRAQLECYFPCHGRNRDSKCSRRRIFFLKNMLAMDLILQPSV